MALFDKHELKTKRQIVDFAHTFMKIFNFYVKTNSGISGPIKYWQLQVR